MNAVSTEIIPFAQIERMAVSAAKSGLFGVKDSDQALALMLIAQAEGVHPARAMQEYHVIQGRPALKADAMLARFQSAGGKVEWREYTDQKVVGTFSHAQGGSITIEWTLERARAAELTDKKNWKMYPRQMLRSRVISEGVRTVYPGVSTGTYTAEEVADMELHDVTSDKPVTIEQAVEQAASALTHDERAEHISAMKEAGDIAGLAAAFSAAWKHAGAANDKPARELFKQVYDSEKASIEAAA